MLERLPPGHRRMLELLRDGYSHGEIAQVLNVTPKAIQRFVAELREQVERA